MWWRVGVAEGRRQGTRLEPKAIAVMAAVGLLAGGFIVFFPPPAPSPEDGLWIVEASPHALLRDAAEGERRFRVIDGHGSAFSAGEADVWMTGDEFFVQDNARGRSAAEVLAVAVREWLNEELASEGDQDAAFPVTVTMAYEPRVQTMDPQPRPPQEAPDGQPTSPSDDDVLDDVEASEVEEDLRPDEVDPPFPIRSLLLTFAYVLPAGLLAQVQAANLHGERTRRRGILILSAPVGPGAILLGKSLPALGATIAIGAVVTIALGAGWLGFLASLSFLAFLYSATTFLAVISRSPRELSLSQVAVTTLLNVFLFLPAMFPSIPPVAFLSPVHVVASGIRGDPVTLGQFLYATLPLFLAAVALAAVAVGLMREELLFSVRSSIGRVLDAVGVMTRRHWRVLAAGVLVVPFVFAAEILVLVTSAVMGLRAAFLLFLPLSVLMEEAAKGIPIWARHRSPGPPRRAWVLGVLVGTGFFLGEKGYLVLTLVGFETLPFGPEALAILGTGPGILLLMVPLALHIITSVLLAVGSARGKVWRRTSFAGAAIIHFAYDQVLLGGIV